MGNGKKRRAPPAYDDEDGEEEPELLKVGDRVSVRWTNGQYAPARVHGTVPPKPGRHGPLVHVTYDTGERESRLAYKHVKVRGVGPVLPRSPLAAATKFPDWSGRAAPPPETVHLEPAR